MFHIRVSGFSLISQGLLLLKLFEYLLYLLRYDKKCDETLPKTGNTLLEKFQSCIFNCFSSQIVTN
jgi:hypothetical protein